MAAIALHHADDRRVDDVVAALVASVDGLYAIDLDALDEAEVGRLLAAGETTLRRVQGMQAKLAQTLIRRRAAAARAQRPDDPRASEKAALGVRRDLVDQLGVTPSRGTLPGRQPVRPPRPRPAHRT